MEPTPAMADNLFDRLDELSSNSDGRQLWAARAPYQPDERYDLMLVPRVRGWEDDAEALEALERIERESWIESVDREGKQVWLRLADSWIERTGAALTSAEAEERPHADLAEGRQF